MNRKHNSKTKTTAKLSNVEASKLANDGDAALAGRRSEPPRDNGSTPLVLRGGFSTDAGPCGMTSDVGPPIAPAPTAPIGSLEPFDAWSKSEGMGSFIVATREQGRGGESWDVNRNSSMSTVTAQSSTT